MTTWHKLLATIIMLTIGIAPGMLVQSGLLPNPKTKDPQVKTTLEMLPRDSGVHFGEPHRIVTKGFSDL